MDAKTLQAIRARADAATPGPWGYGDFGFVSNGNQIIVQTWDRMEENFDNSRNNGEFIAHARTDIPALLDEVARLREELDAARREADDADRETERLREAIQRGKSISITYIQSEIV